jgi:hypothetical protein
MRPPGRFVAVAVILVLLPVVLAVAVPGGTARRTTPPKGPLILARSRVLRLPGKPPRPQGIVLLAHGSWCWFGDPRAVHAGGPNGPTFVGWIGWHGQITIAAYEPRRHAVQMRVIGHQAVDDHGSPSILVEPDRRLIVFWSGHGGPTMNYRTSRRPLGIAAWGPVHHVRSALPGPLGYTYPNPVLLDGDRDTLFLFWRGTDWSQDFATRAGDGRWSPARRLITVSGERPYVKVGSDGRQTIALAFTNGHPRNVLTSIYFVSYRDGELWTASGRRIGALNQGPISPAQADLVYDARRTGVRSWVWDVALARGGRPVIVYATFPSKRRHVYWYATFSHRRWISHRLTTGGPSISPRTIEQEYSGGVALDHRDPSIVFLSHRVGRWFEIERWSTPDEGYTWRYQTVVRTPGANDIRPIVPRDARGGAMGLLWLQGDYGSYKRYRTSIAFAR